MLICKHCSSRLSGCNVTRLKAHLISAKCDYLESKAAETQNDADVQVRVELRGLQHHILMLCLLVIAVTFSCLRQEPQKF